MKEREQGWQAYIHENGSLQIKMYCEDVMEIDYNSPFVKEYLGELLNTEKKRYSREEAEEYFSNQTKG